MPGAVGVFSILVATMLTASVAPGQSGDFSESRPILDSAPEIVGDDAFAFRKHLLDIGRSEGVTVADVNRDGRLDIVSGETGTSNSRPLVATGRAL